MTLEVSGLPALPEGETVHALADEGRRARRVVRVVRRGRRDDEGAAQRAVPPEAVRRLGVVADAARRRPLLTQRQGLTGLRRARYRRDRARARPDGVVRTQYEDFARHVLTTGVPKHDRTGTGTVSVFGYQMRFDLAEGFPLVTTKKVHFPSIAYELLWFLRGDGERPLAAGARRHDLGRVGRRGRRPRPRLRRAVAQLADPGRRPRRPDRRGRAAAARGPRLAPDHRQRLERRRPPEDGARAVPRVLPVPRRGRRAPQLPALPAQRRRLPRRPVQHRELRAAHAHARAAVRPRGRRADLDGRRLPRLRQPPRAGRDAARARARIPYPTLALRRRPASIFDYAFEDFEVVGYEHHPAIRAPVAV